MQKYLEQFLYDICSNDCIIDAFIADKLKRAVAKLCKSHSGYFSCEYCESKGQLLKVLDAGLIKRKQELLKQKENITEQIAQANDDTQKNALQTVQKSIDEAIKTISKKNHGIVWPSSTSNGPKRTEEKILEIVDKLDADEVLSLDDAKGILGHSLLLDIPYFEFILHSPAEYLHSTCLGVSKKMIELTFNVGQTRSRNTTRKFSSPQQFNKSMSSIKCPRESSRRARSLDFAVMKGQEFRNITLIFFPIVVNCIEETAKERRLWLLYAYLIRLCTIPENEYQTVDSANLIDYCSKHFYKLYELLFGEQNCTYNTHVVACHMPELRALGPLTCTSAFGFESFYGELRNSFAPGTQSPLKQIMQKVLIKRAISPHCCNTSIYFSPKESSLESNCHIYTFTNDEYNFYKIMSIQDNLMECCKVGKYVTSFPETPTLKWEKVGVFKAGEISDEIVTIDKENVCGKFIKVNDLFITCPNNVLREK